MCDILDKHDMSGIRTPKGAGSENFCLRCERSEGKCNKRSKEVSWYKFLSFTRMSWKEFIKGSKEVLFMRTDSESRADRPFGPSKYRIAGRKVGCVLIIVSVISAIVFICHIFCNIIKT